MAPLFIGIDVAKDRLDVNVQPSGAAFTVTRDESGLADLVRRLATLGPQLIALEATGAVAIIRDLSIKLVATNELLADEGRRRAGGRALARRFARHFLRRMSSAGADHG